MSQFLTAGDLAAAIKDILSGGDVRCAVAYWGKGSDAPVRQSASFREVRIICDVTRGGTSPNALIELGATKNRKLRHIPDLHAKVYLSDRGAVVGSANASNNGIGFDGAPGLIEAGVLVQPNEDAYGEAAAWFEVQWKRSKKVDKDALEIAKKRFRPSGGATGGKVRSGSLLDLILNDPDRFSEVSIVLVRNETKEEDRIRARSAMIKTHPNEEEAIARMPDNGMFIGWNPADLARWRRSFIELWMPGERLHCYGRKALYFHDQTGTVMSRKHWSAIRSVIDVDIPDPSEISKSDHQVVRRLLKEHGNVVFTARELAAAVEAL